MKISRCIAVAGLGLLSSIGIAQQPRITMDMINTVLPEEGAPKAEPGRYTVMSEPASGAAGLKLFRPADLTRFPQQDTLPVVVWGNGGCAVDAPRYAGFLETIASHGFLVITTAGAVGAAPADPAAPRRSATVDDMKAALDWAEREAARAGSPLSGKIELRQMALMGQSCGGMLSMRLGADARVRTVASFNAGLSAAERDSINALRGPVLLINGHERDFQMADSKATFDAISTLPSFYGARRGAGHTATAYHPGGGEFANVATNWVRWQLKGDKAAGQMFSGPQCKLCTNPDWEVERKRLAD